MNLCILIFLESKLRCTYCTSSGHLILTCAIRFYGIWAPKIKWSRSSGHVNDAIENGEVTSTLTIPPMSQEVNYTASVYFSETDRPTEVTATNIPTYDAEWSSPLFTAEGYGEGWCAIFFIPKHVSRLSLQLLMVLLHGSRPN